MEKWFFVKARSRINKRVYLIKIIFTKDDDEIVASFFADQHPEICEVPFKKGKISRRLDLEERILKKK